MNTENPRGFRDSRGTATRHAKNMKLTLEAPPYGGAVVLHCSGRLVFRDEADALSTMLGEVLPSVRKMVVNLADVKSVDSAGLGELVLLHMWADAAGYSLKLACPNASVRHLLELTNLVSVLDVYSSVAEAVSAMRHEELLLA
jgi:anti-sigma B factor antagonist